MISSQASHPYTRPQAVRLGARHGQLTGPTAGLANGYVQVNLVILPEAQANGFLRFCQANPKPCPLIAVSEPGDRSCQLLAEDLDIARDVPSYCWYRDGELVARPQDVSDLWRDDLVTFALGCSFSFEHALLQNGLPVRHIQHGRNVPMYRTSLPLVSAGGFSGTMVVSMRPYRAVDAIRAIQITTRYPQAHGAPVHFGDPSLIGIHDLDRPDYGDAVPVDNDETPVFWACGVTPQQVLMDAGVPFAITHNPGHMLVTDIPESQVALL